MVVRCFLILVLPLDLNIYKRIRIRIYEFEKKSDMGNMGMENEMEKPKKGNEKKTNDKRTMRGIYRQRFHWWSGIVVYM